MHELPRNCRCFTKFKICKAVSFNKKQKKVIINNKKLQNLKKTFFAKKTIFLFLVLKTTIDEFLTHKARVTYLIYIDVRYTNSKNFENPSKCRFRLKSKCHILLRFFFSRENYATIQQQYERLRTWYML